MHKIGLMFTTLWKTPFPAGIYLLKVNNRNTGTRCEICSKLTIKILERRQRRRPGIFIVNFEHISHLVLVFLLLTFAGWVRVKVTSCRYENIYFKFNVNVMKFGEQYQSLSYVWITNYVFCSQKIFEEEYTIYLCS